MDAPVSAGYAAPDARSERITLPARPEPLRLKLSETAVIVVDMQNAYATEGGYIDIAGFDVSGAPAAIAKTKATLEAARTAGLTVIFFQNGWDKD
jgi:ureidoacrylate peracid hydrolase